MFGFGSEGHAVTFPEGESLRVRFVERALSWIEVNGVIQAEYVCPWCGKLGEFRILSEMSDEAVVICEKLYRAEFVVEH